MVHSVTNFIHAIKRHFVHYYVATKHSNSFVCELFKAPVSMHFAKNGNLEVTTSTLSLPAASLKSLCSYGLLDFPVCTLYFTALESYSCRDLKEE